MSNQWYPTEFCEEAVRQVIERGYLVKEVSERLDVSTYSLYKWIQAAKHALTKQKDEELMDAKREVLKHSA